MGLVYLGSPHWLNQSHGHRLERNPRSQNFVGVNNSRILGRPLGWGESDLDKIKAKLLVIISADDMVHI
jgi:hypothetical protein